MVIKDEEADNELMKSVSSGELKETLNEIISKLKPEIKIENLRLQEKEVVETYESFEMLEKKSSRSSMYQPYYCTPKSSKSKLQSFVIHLCISFQKVDSNRILGNL